LAIACAAIQPQWRVTIIIVVGVWPYIAASAGAVVRLPEWRPPAAMIGEPLRALFPISELAVIGLFLVMIAVLAVAQRRRP